METGSGATFFEVCLLPVYVWENDEEHISMAARRRWWSPPAATAFFFFFFAILPPPPPPSKSPRSAGTCHKPDRGVCWEAWGSGARGMWGEGV